MKSTAPGFCEWRCVYCGKPFAGDRSVDHIVPLSAGGRDVRLNRVPACLRCNQNKRSKHLPDIAHLPEWQRYHTLRVLDHARRHLPELVHPELLSNLRTAVPLRYTYYSNAKAIAT